METLSIRATGEPLQSPASAPPPGLRRIVLTGFMGAGKSTAGRLLALHLGWTFLDLDAHLEARAGATVPELFRRHGEPGFRRLESSALASALRQISVVLALGGGAPETLTNRLLLEQTPGTLTVFLDAPFPILFDRCMLQALNPGAPHPDRVDQTDTLSPADPQLRVAPTTPPAPRDADRPNLRDPDAALARFNLRHPLYRRLARVTVDTSHLTPAQTAPAILQAIADLA